VHANTPDTAWKESESSTYSEHPEVAPEPTTSTRPYAVDAADTVA
jgi:hypothetical protein